ncbi:hypothetical protein Tco_1058847 [Tanacetum coccineum]
MMFSYLSITIHAVEDISILPILNRLFRCFDNGTTVISRERNNLCVFREKRCEESGRIRLSKWEREKSRWKWRRGTFEGLVQKLIDEDNGRQNAILDLALQFKNSCTTKDDLRKAYEKCNDISQESRALIDTFLKEGSDKDYELNLSILDIDDSDLHLTPVVRSSSSTHVEPSPYIPNPVRIIPGSASIVQQAKMLKENVFILDSDGALMSTQEYMQKIVEDVGEDDDFKSGAWVSATNYVTATGGTVTGCLGDIDNNLKKEKLDQVVAIVKSCSPNALGELTITIKDISGAAMILVNVSVFTHKPSKHYLNITKRNVVNVFCKDTVPGSGSG